MISFMRVKYRAESEAWVVIGEVFINSAFILAVSGIGGDAPEDNAITGISFINDLPTMFVQGVPELVAQQIGKELQA